MKKRFTTLMMLLTIGCSSLFSQTLENTTWKVYYPNGTFFLYFHFSNDSLFYSPNNISYAPAGLGFVSGDTLRCVDLPAGQCSVNDTGIYKYLIRNDSLFFTMIYDVCGSRVSTLTTFLFVRSVEGIPGTTVDNMIHLFPNPASDEFFITAPENMRGKEFFILDLSGRKILEGMLSGEITRVDITTMVSGSYIICIDEKRTISKMMIKKR
jgi:hypothetical protein